jgi:Virulence factor BrkB
MAWLWKQGRPSLLAVVGLGFLGYKALHSRRKAHRQEQVRTGVVNDNQRMTTRVTPTPAGKRTKAPFLGGLSITELVRRVWREVQDDNGTGQAAQLAYYLMFAIFPFLLFLITLLGYLPIPISDGAHDGVYGQTAAWGDRYLAPRHHPATGHQPERRIAILWHSRHALVGLKCGNGHDGCPEPGL